MLANTLTSGEILKILYSIIEEYILRAIKLMHGK